MRIETLRITFKNYIRAAFNARPIGMLVPPNWIFLAFFGLLGCINTGFWVLGAGLEFGYLYALSTNKRFQNLVNFTYQVSNRQQWGKQLETIISGLDEEDQRRYRELEKRCRKTLEQNYPGEQDVSVKLHSEGLKRLLWIYLRLMLTRRSIIKTMNDSLEPGDGRDTLETRINKLESRLSSKSVNDELRKSLAGQVDILKQRLEKQRQAKEKLAFLEAELTRIQEQAELLREQTALSTNPQALSQQIDQISETLGGTMEWIQEQQQIYGNIEDMTTEPPPFSIEPKKKEMQ
jgi:hypothetical protein